MSWRVLYEDCQRAAVQSLRGVLLLPDVRVEDTGRENVCFNLPGRELEVGHDGHRVHVLKDIVFSTTPENYRQRHTATMRVMEPV